MKTARSVTSCRGLRTSSQMPPLEGVLPTWRPQAVTFWEQMSLSLMVWRIRATRIPFTSPMRNAPIRSIWLTTRSRTSAGSVMPWTLIKTRRIKLWLMMH